MKTPINTDKNKALSNRSSLRMSRVFERVCKGMRAMYLAVINLGTSQRY